MRRSSLLKVFVLRFLYDAGFLLFAIAYLPVFFMKGKHRLGMGSRFGAVPDDVRRSLSGRRVVWIHAVSVGEMALALRLADAVRAKFTDVKILLTVTTVAGWGVAEKAKHEEDALLFFPADFRPSVRAFIRSTSPAAVVLLETEIWPNLIFELSARRVPVYILNGRISDKAYPKYRRLGAWLGAVLERLSFVGAQDERMRERFIAIGAPPEKVAVTGNIKFDWRPDAARERQAEALGRRIKRPGDFFCIAGSTHEGEEEILFEIFAKLRRESPEFQLLIAPRHLERMPSIEAAAAKRGVALKKVSEAGSGDASAEAVWILDQMGVLACLYQAADAVVMGGSFVPVGGHNLVEPAFYEKPVLFGPYMQNFRDMADQFLAASAAIAVNGAEDLERQLAALMKDSAKRKGLGLAAGRLVRQSQGATERNLARLVLDERK